MFPHRTEQMVGPEPREASFASSVVRRSCSVAPWPGQLNRWPSSLMRRKILFALITVVLGVSLSGTARSQVVARFGGECHGDSFNPSARLRRLISESAERASLFAKLPDGEAAFAYDLNGDGQKEYFVRLACGGTGNCDWGIFSTH